MDHMPDRMTDAIKPRLDNTYISMEEKSRRTVSKYSVVNREKLNSYSLTNEIDSLYMGRKQSTYLIPEMPPVEFNESRVEDCLFIYVFSLYNLEQKCTAKKRDYLSLQEDSEGILERLAFNDEACTKSDGLSQSVKKKSIFTNVNDIKRVLVTVKRIPYAAKIPLSDYGELGGKYKITCFLDLLKIPKHLHHSEYGQEDGNWYNKSFVFVKSVIKYIITVMGSDAENSRSINEICKANDILTEMLNSSSYLTINRVLNKIVVRKSKEICYLGCAKQIKKTPYFDEVVTKPNASGDSTKFRDLNFYIDLNEQSMKARTVSTRSNSAKKRSQKVRCDINKNSSQDNARKSEESISFECDCKKSASNDSVKSNKSSKSKKKKNKKPKKVKKKNSKESNCSNNSSSESVNSKKGKKKKSKEKPKKAKEKTKKGKQKCQCVVKCKSDCSIGSHNSSCSDVSSKGSVKSDSTVTKCETKPNRPAESCPTRFLTKLKETLNSCGLPVGGKTAKNNCLATVSGSYRMVANYSTGKIDIDVDKKSRKMLMSVLNRLSEENEKPKKKK